MQTDGEFSKRRVEMGHFGGPPPGARVRRWSRLACRCFLRRSLCVQRWPRVVADELAEGMIAAFRADAKHCGSAAGDSRSGVQLRHGRSVILCLGPAAWGCPPDDGRGGVPRSSSGPMGCTSSQQGYSAPRHHCGLWRNRRVSTAEDLQRLLGRLPGHLSRSDLTANRPV